MLLPCYQNSECDFYFLIFGFIACFFVLCTFVCILVPMPRKLYVLSKMSSVPLAHSGGGYQSGTQPGGYQCPCPGHWACVPSHQDAAASVKLPAAQSLAPVSRGKYTALTSANIITELSCYRIPRPEEPRPWTILG